MNISSALMVRNWLAAHTGWPVWIVTFISGLFRFSSKLKNEKLKLFCTWSCVIAMNQNSEGGEGSLCLTYTIILHIHVACFRGCLESSTENWRHDDYSKLQSNGWIKGSSSVQSGSFYNSPLWYKSAECLLAIWTAAGDYIICMKNHHRFRQIIINSGHRHRASL